MSDLLKSAAGMAEIFLACLDPGETPSKPLFANLKPGETVSQEQAPRRLAERLVAVNLLVD